MKLCIPEAAKLFQQRSTKNNIKFIIAFNSPFDPNWNLVESKKNNTRRSNNCTIQKESNIFTSHSLQHIIDNYSTLNINELVFNYNNASAFDN